MFEEKSDHVRADVAGASSNENAHALSLHTISQNRTETNFREMVDGGSVA